MNRLLSALLVCGTALSAAAQTAPRFKSTCDSNRGGGKDLKGFCETRDLTMPAPGQSQKLNINADPNGGISVCGWDGPDVRIRVKIQTWATTEAEATARARRISIGTAANTLRATEPDKEKNWSVSYEVFVPRATALALNTVNGGISLSDLNSAITFETTNGGISLANLGGQVKGETTNGGVSISLGGTKWEGQGLDVKTTNGGITWQLPRTYSARFYTSTNMGGVSTSLPVTKSGMFHKTVETSLGQGGATVRAVTTNGGIRVNQTRD